MKTTEEQIKELRNQVSNLAKAQLNFNKIIEKNVTQLTSIIENQIKQSQKNKRDILDLQNRVKELEK